MFRLRKISYLFLAFGLFTTMPKTAQLNASNNIQLTNESFQNIKDLGEKLVGLLQNIETTINAIDFNSVSNNIPTSQLKTTLFKHYASCLDWNEVFALRKANLTTEKIAQLGGYAAAEILSKTFTIILSAKKLHSSIPNGMEVTYNNQIDIYIQQIETIINNMTNNLNLSADAKEQTFINTFVNGKTFNNIKNATTYNKLCEIKKELETSIPKKIQELIDSAQNFYTDTINTIAQI